MLPNKQFVDEQIFHDAPVGDTTEHLFREITNILRRNKNKEFLTRVLRCVIAYERAEK